MQSCSSPERAQELPALAASDHEGPRWFMS